MHVPEEVRTIAGAANGFSLHPVTQVVLVVAIIGPAMYLVVTGQPVPDWLIGLASGVVGYYFKAGVSATAGR